jgi:hypothetical protein
VSGLSKEVINIMTDFFDDFIGTATDLFDTGYEAADEWLGDILPDLGEGGSKAVTDLVFGSGDDGGLLGAASKALGVGSGSGSSGSSLSKASSKIKSVGRGTRRTSSVKGSTGGSNAQQALSSVDPRAVEARWLVRLDRIGQMTGKV